jgi:hypothetical protein
VLAEAGRLAARVERETRDPAAQVDAAYRMALARPATPAEVAVGTALIKRESLEAFAHVVLNLDEFVYMR